MRQRGAAGEERAVPVSRSSVTLSARLVHHFWATWGKGDPGMQPVFK